MKLKEIPNSWLILIIVIGMIGMRCLGIDSFVTAGLSTIIGYLTGVKLEQGRKRR